MFLGNYSHGPSEMRSQIFGAPSRRLRRLRILKSPPSLRERRLFSSPSLRLPVNAAALFRLFACIPRQGVFQIVRVLMMQFV